MEIGKKLLNFAIDFKRNTQALKFYGHRGFKRTNNTNCDSEGKNYLVISLELA